MTASPIMTLFREFEVKYRQAGDLSLGEEVATGLLDECKSLEKRIMTTRSISAQDFAAKLIASTRYGDFLLDSVGEGGLLDEALAILAVHDHPDAKLIDLGQQFEAAKAELRSAKRRWARGQATHGAFDKKVDEAITVMRAIYRTKAKTLGGLVVKLEAVAFDLFDFDMDSKEADVAEVQLLRLCKQARQLTKLQCASVGRSE